MTTVVGFQEDSDHRVILPRSLHQRLQHAHHFHEYRRLPALRRRLPSDDSGKTSIQFTSPSREEDGVMAITSTTIALTHEARHEDAIDTEVADLAATKIQEAWRSVKERRVARMGQQNGSIGDNEDTQRKDYAYVTTDGWSGENGRSRSVLVNEDTMVAIEVANLAAAQIQKAWRSVKEKRMASMGQQNGSTGHNEDTQQKDFPHATTDEWTSEHRRSRNVPISEDTERVESSNEFFVPGGCLASSLKMSTGCNLYIDGNDTSRSRLSGSDSSSSSAISRSTSSDHKKMEQVNDNLSRHTFRWRPASWGGDQSWRKVLLRPFRSIGNESGNAQLVRKVPVFNLLEDHVVDAICEKLCFKVYRKGSKIFRVKKPVEHMLFIAHGELNFLGEEGTTGPVEAFCGEELLPWCSAKKVVGISNKIHHEKYPKSTRTIECVTKVEAYTLDWDALQAIATRYHDDFSSSRVQSQMRCFSLYWRSLAATEIQKSWRSMKERRGTLHSQQSCPMLDEKDRGHDNEKPIESSSEYPVPGSNSDQDTQQEKHGSMEIDEVKADTESSFVESSGDISNIKDNAPSWKDSQSGNIRGKTDDHIRKKRWWSFGRPEVQIKPGPQRMSYDQLRLATGVFGEESKLGSGSLGSVYRGVVPSSGVQVAVKKKNGFPAHSKGQREFKRQFKSEISILSHLEHQNLLPLLGWYEDVVKQEYLLVYEFMPNGNLARALFEPMENETSSLSWPQRFNIVDGIAGALNYLHHDAKEQVIHGNIKPSNILLDNELQVKLGDIGHACLAQQPSTSKISAAPSRTAYLAPEGVTSGKFTDKTDVFAFGAIVLEIVCGRKAISDSVPPEEKILVDWVWTSLSEGNLLDTVDKRLGDYDVYSMEVLLLVGLICSHPNPLARPSMSNVVEILAGEAPVPTVPTSKPTPGTRLVPERVPVHDSHRPTEDVTRQFDGIPQRFSYEQLRAATNGFSKESKLGQGGFGSVYQGVLPSSNIRVAVKKMSSHWAQGQGVKEFMSEVAIISRLRHRNLIELLGWCEDVDKQEYLLVYELMHNGSLDDVLFGPAGKERPCLTWSQRFNALKGTAAALEYLHQGWKQQIIHRDIKCSNIMLDENWNAQLGDFGLARMVDHHRGVASTSVAGTVGYMAPEVLADGNFTDKADVFGFGAVLLEVVCGRRVCRTSPDQVGVVNWVWRCLNDGDLLSAVDKRLEEYNTYWMKVLLMVGLLCSHPDPLVRPSMRQVVLVLAGDAPVPPIPASKPTPMFSTSFQSVSIDQLTRPVEHPR